MTDYGASTAAVLLSCSPAVHLFFIALIARVFTLGLVAGCSITSFAAIVYLTYDATEPQEPWKVRWRCPTIWACHRFNQRTGATALARARVCGRLHRCLRYLDSCSHAKHEDIALVRGDPI